MKPLNNKIQLEIEELKFGAIESDSIAECGKIIAVGNGVYDTEMTTSANDNVTRINHKFAIGKTLYFKAWAIDVITKDDKKYYFISSDSDAICAISE